MDFLESLFFLAAILLSLYFAKQTADDGIEKINRRLEKLNVELWQVRPGTFFFLRLGNDGKKRYCRQPVYQRLVTPGYILITDPDGNRFELPELTPVRVCSSLDQLQNRQASRAT
jgi:hypothetical protein